MSAAGQSFFGAVFAAINRHELSLLAAVCVTSLLASCSVSAPIITPLNQAPIQLGAAAREPSLPDGCEWNENHSSYSCPGYVGGASYISGPSYVGGTSSISGPSSMSGASYAGGVSSVGGASYGAGPSYVGGTSSISAQTAISGPGYVSGQSSVSGPSSLSGTSYTTGPSSISGNGSYAATSSMGGPSPAPGKISATNPQQALQKITATAPTPQALPQAITAKSAKQLLPYAAMSSDAYGNTHFSANYNFHLVTNSDSIFSSQSNQAASVTSQVTGFHADVFVNSTTKQLVVAFRGTDPTDLRDWAENFNARVGIIPDAYKLAAQLAQGVKQTTTAGGQFAGYSVVLTGQSLGGAEASYAGSVTGLSSVTFEAARNRASEINAGSAQINVIVPADAIGSHGNSLLSIAPSFALGEGNLRGTTYAVNETETGLAVHDPVDLYEALKVIAQ